LVVANPATVAPVITSGSSTTFGPVTATTGSSGPNFTVTTTGFPAPVLADATYTDSQGNKCTPSTLPAGVTFTDNGDGTATIANSPGANTGGTYTVCVTATSSSGAAYQKFTLTVTQVPAINSANSTTFSTGTASTFLFNSTGFPYPAFTDTSFSGCTASDLTTTGVTFTDNHNGTATLGGTPTANAGGTYTICVNASNGLGSTATRTFTLTINQGPVITSAGSTTFAVGTAGSFSVTATGYPAPTLSETGTLPTGVSFSNGVLSGTPAAGKGGVYSLTFTASNTVGTVNQPFTLTVNQAPAITSGPSATFSTGKAGSFTVTTTGYPKPALTNGFLGCTPSTLPSGVTFTDNGNGTATLAGTPAAGTGGTYTVCVNAANGVGSAATQNFTLTVNQTPVFTSGGSASFTAGTAGTFTVTATGFPAPALTETGTLPGGLTFHDNGNGTATLSGTPAISSGGTYTLTFNASSSSGTATQSFTLTVKEAPAITSANNVTFSTGTASSFTVTTRGFPAPAITDASFAGCTASTLPAGVTLTNNSNGTATLAGTPAAGTGGTYTLCLNAANGVGSAATQPFTLTIYQAPAITSGASATFSAGNAGSFTVLATGFPAPALTETGALPAGMSFNQATGVLSGTPAPNSGNSYNITFTANSAAGTATQSFTLIVQQSPGITSPNNTSFAAGSAHTFTVTTSGFPLPALTNAAFTGCNPTALPSGVTFTDSGNGTANLSGTPAAGSGGVYTLCFNASNGVGSPATQRFTLTVTQTPAITSTATTTFIEGLAGSFPVTATGFPVPALTDANFAGCTKSALPSGVIFTDNGNGTATLAGSPATGSHGSYTVCVNATNSAATATQIFTLTVVAQQAPAITSANQATFVTGTSGSFTVTTSGEPTPAITNASFIGCTPTALPSGVTFTDNGNGTASLTGTPAANTGGVYTLCLNAANGVGSPATLAFTLTVNQPPQITSPSSAIFAHGQAGTFDVTATGFPTTITFSETGSLPSGVTFTAAGVLSGTPNNGATGKSYPITITATNGINPPATQSFTLNVS
jgi:hypothetical protein